KTIAGEYYSTKEDQTFALDQIFQMLRAYTIDEITITLLAPSIDVEELCQYLEISKNGAVRIISDRCNVSYQNELFSRVFDIQSMLSPVEYLDLEKSPLVSEALAVLIHFLIEHDQALVYRLK